MRTKKKVEFIIFILKINPKKDFLDDDKSH